jgi:predicted nicotinamide N-methyase
MDRGNPPPRSGILEIKEKAPADVGAEVDGRRVRPVTLEVATGIRVTVLEAADADDLLAAALEDDAGLDPYAGVLWPTALAVARALVDDVSSGDRVVDLGAGTGLAGLTAARLGARVVALDHDPFALRLIDRAAALQGLEVETRRFDLHGAEPLPPADVVVLADILYEPALARSAARRAAEAAAAGARVIVGDPGRLSRAEFLHALALLGHAPEFVETRVRLPGDPVATTVGIARLGGRPRPGPGR